MKLFYSLFLICFLTVSLQAGKSIQFQGEKNHFPTNDRSVVFDKNDDLHSTNEYYSEDFNDGRIPSDMTFYDLDENQSPYNNWNDGPWVPYQIDLGEYVMISTSYYNPPGQADDWMITPAIEIGSNAFLRWEAWAWNSNLRDGYEVLVSTTGTEVADFETVIFSTTAENTTMTERFVNLEDEGFKDQTIYIAFRNNSNRKFVLGIDDISVYTPDTYDIIVHYVDLPLYQKINDPIQFEGILQNFGTETVTNFTLNYTDNDGEVVSDQISGVNIPLHEYYEFTHQIAWETDETGEHNLRFWVTDINGKEDQFTENDEFTGIVNIYDPAMTYPRLSMYEIFTSATCPPCKPGNEDLQAVLDNHEGEYSLLKYQMDWPGSGDIYYTAEGGVRKNYYNVSGVPSAHIDGNDGFNPNGFNEATFEYFAIFPAFLELNANYSITDQTVNAEVFIDSKVDIDENDLVLLGAIFEYTTYDNKASNGETEFYHVMKKMLPNANGTIIDPVSKDEQQHYTFSYTFPKSNTVEEFDDLGVVFFLQDRSSKQVFNSTTAVLETVGVNDAPKNGITAVFPNPTGDISYLNYIVKTAGENVSVDIYTIDGNMVESIDEGYRSTGNHMIPLNFSDFTSGVYVVKLRIGTEVFTQKVSVTR